VTSWPLVLFILRHHTCSFPESLGPCWNWRSVYIFCMYLYIYIPFICQGHSDYFLSWRKSRNLRLPSIGSHLAQPLSGRPWIHEVPASNLSCQQHMTRLIPPLWLWQTGYNLFSKFFVSSALCSFCPISWNTNIPPSSKVQPGNHHWRRSGAKFQRILAEHKALPQHFRAPPAHKSLFQITKMAKN
jgi:hypothetical protein